MKQTNSHSIRYWVISLLLIVSNGCYQGVNAQSDEGIVFFEGTWQETLDKAKQENKMIFMDCYTAWCGPCKKLAKEVFPDAKLGKEFNQRFVSVKIDMEKGEGIDLKDQLSVSAFPTMLFINQEGEEQHRIVGYRTAEKLLAEANKAVGEKSFGALQQRYNNGERDKAFIIEYINVLKSAGKREELDIVATEKLMELKPQLWLKDENWAMIKAFVVNPHSDIIQYIQKNQNRFIAAHGTRAIEMKLYGAFAGGSKNFLVDIDGVKRLDKKGYGEYIQMLEDLDVKRRENMKLEADMHYAFALEQWAKYTSLVNEKIAADGDNLHPQIMWNYALRVNKMCPDTATRAEAAKWCKVAIERTDGERSKKSFQETYESLLKPMEVTK